MQMYMCASRQELSAAEVHRRLQTGAQKQQQPRHHRLSVTAKRPSPRSKPQQRPTTSPHQQHQAGKQTTALVLSPGHVQQSPPTAQQRQEERGQGGGSSGSVGGSSQLPAGVQFVTVAWVSSCLRSRQRWVRKGRVMLCLSNIFDTADQCVWGQWRSILTSLLPAIIKLGVQLSCQQLQCNMQASRCLVSTLPLHFSTVIVGVDPKPQHEPASQGLMRVPIGPDSTCA
jgi:hypothetical protein